MRRAASVVEMLLLSPDFVEQGRTPAVLYRHPGISGAQHHFFGVLVAHVVDGDMAGDRAGAAYLDAVVPDGDVHRGPLQAVVAMRQRICHRFTQYRFRIFGQDVAPGPDDGSEPAGMAGEKTQAAVDGFDKGSGSDAGFGRRPLGKKRTYGQVDG